VEKESPCPLVEAPLRWLQPENLPTWLQREAVALVGLREDHPLPWAVEDKCRVARVHRIPHPTGDFPKKSPMIGDFFCEKKPAI